MAVGQWKKYYVHLAGDTGGSHQEFLFYLNRSRQSQVFTPAESDYVLIFCPVFSEPAREIEQTLVNFPGGKFVVGTNQLLQLLKYPHYFCILMLAFVWKEKLFLRQETFHVAQPFSSLTKHSCVSPSLTVGKPTILLVMHHQSESVPRNQTHVTSPNVYLTLDILHYQGKFKRCQPNNVAVKAVIILIQASYKNQNRKVSVVCLHDCTLVLNDTVWLLFNIWNPFFFVFSFSFPIDGE